ncbi:VOC family protein [Kordiimonas aquimaris]|uniref:VOC family protein n=1 Tax=Kordiimonas aquimaris TaxID=707591 RepID=UPI0021CF62D5|nr:VOC family protein [Kordiimonas aquimaris]
MILGAFSLSLTVKNIEISRDFYEKLGFEKFHGDEEQGWLIMKSPSVVIGLFQGMFDKNMLTFNPGWDNNANEVNPFTDVRDIQKAMLQAGITVENEIDGQSNGPANCMITDPDGNPILIDQHR